MIEILLGFFIGVILYLIYLTLLEMYYELRD